MAINFPSTTGQATDGSFTHTASGVTWAWDGTTWQSQGVTGAYVLPTATATSLGGVKVGSGLAINSTTSVLSATASAITIEEEGTALTNAATTLNFVGTNVTATGTGATKTITITGGGSGLQTRTTANGTTSSIANDASADLTIVAAKTYVLQKIQTDKAAWVVLYTDGSARTADSARNITTDPNPGSGVIAEVITTGAQTQVITPGTIGWNNDGTPGTDAYLKVVNKSGATGTVQVTLHFLQIEA